VRRCFHSIDWPFIGYAGACHVIVVIIIIIIIIMIITITIIIIIIIIIIGSDCNDSIIIVILIIDPYMNLGEIKRRTQEREKRVKSYF